MCLRPVAFQGCEEASGHGWQGREYLGGQWWGVPGECGDCLNLWKLQLLKHQNPSYHPTGREREAGAGESGSL